MKNLRSYIDDKQTAALEKAGAFFAFSQSQYDEAAKEGVNYVNMGSGLICPKENAKELWDDLQRTYKEGVEQDKEENGKDAIILRELHNHEYGYTMDISQTVEALEEYGYSAEDVQKVANNQDWSED